MEKVWSFVVSPRIIPGVIVLCWTLLAQASTAQFAWTLGSSISSWLDKHAWVGFLVGFGLLASTFAWSDLKNRFPAWLRFPRSTGDRIDDLERRYAENIKASSGILELLSKSMESSSRTHDLTVQTSDKVYEEKDNVLRRFTTVDKRLSVVEDHLRQFPVFVRSLIDISLLDRDTNELYAKYKKAGADERRAYEKIQGYRDRLMWAIVNYELRRLPSSRLDIYLTALKTGGTIPNEEEYVMEMFKEITVYLNQSLDSQSENVFGWFEVSSTRP